MDLVLSSKLYTPLIDSYRYLNKIYSKIFSVNAGSDRAAEEESIQWHEDECPGAVGSSQQMPCSGW